MSTLIKNIQIIDGSGIPPFNGAVLFSNGKIQDIFSDVRNDFCIPYKSVCEIDGKGMILCPGFIDVHSHSDMTLLVNPLAESKIRQGVTLEVIGNCGTSGAPIFGPQKTSVEDAELYGLNVDWEDMNEYLQRLSKTKPSLNIAALAGHGNIRASVIGFDDIAPSEEQLKAMVYEVEKALDAGAFGISTGLIYPVGCYASTDELKALAKPLSRYNSIYSSHIRGEGERVLTAVNEALSIGREAQCRVQISHLKAAGKKVHGLAPALLNKIEQSDGMAAADRYPYNRSSTSLGSLFPDDFHIGGKKDFLQRLQTDSFLKRAKALIDDSPVECGWNGVLVAHAPENPELEGLSMAEIAIELSMSPFDSAIELLLKNRGSVQVCNHTMSEKDTAEILAHPRVMPASDASAKAHYGMLSAGKPHPRAFGTFTRFLRKYVLDKKGDLSTAIHKMTNFPANWFNIKNRGLLKKGYWADMVLFNPDSISDGATFTNPFNYGRGIESVWVNGELVFDGNNHTEKQPGHVLRA